MRFYKLLLIFCVLLLITLPAQAETAGAQYRELKRGDAGYDVYLLKVRLYQLGYLSTDRGTENYTAGFEKTIRTVQEANGLEPTGVATPDLQVLVFSDDCRLLLSLSALFSLVSFRSFFTSRWLCFFVMKPAVFTALIKTSSSDRSKVSFSI